MDNVLIRTLMLHLCGLFLLENQFLILRANLDLVAQFEFTGQQLLMPAFTLLNKFGDELVLFIAILILPADRKLGRNGVIFMDGP
jgi:hypothetical protein